jgi:hypothetical protein
MYTKQVKYILKKEQGKLPGIMNVIYAYLTFFLIAFNIR